MRKARAVLIPSLFVLALMLSVPLVSYSQSQSQNREKFGISAKAGGVNAVTGRATMRPHGNSEWQLLTIKEDLETGDVVRTGLDGRVEMLLNPGSYMRVGENAEFELSDNSLDNLEVRLLKGTAIVEVTGADDEELFIGITTPHARMSIVRRGLYRVNVVPGGDTTELIVRKGRVMLEGSHTKVKGGNKVVFSGNSFSVAKLTDAEKKDRDTLAVWSKDRGQALAQANSRIPGRTLMAYASYASSFRDSGWLYSPPRRGYGVWVFNPAVGYYTFFPYYDDFSWSSPYGKYYSIFLYGGPNWGGRYGRPIYRGEIGSGRLGGPGGAGGPGRSGGPSGSPASDPGSSRINPSPMGGSPMGPSPTSASPMSHGGSERGGRPGNREP